MNRKLLPNRSSKAPAADALTKVRQAIQLLNEALGDEIAITDEDYKGLRRIADKIKRVTDDVFEIAKENTDFVKAPLSIAEMAKDKAFYELCDSIRALLDAFFLRLEREQNVTGAEYQNACSVFEGDVDNEVKRDSSNAKAMNVQAQLEKIDRNRAGAPSKNNDKLPK